MEKIKDLTVKMTFTVIVDSVTISDQILSGLHKIADKGGITDMQAIMSKDKDIIEAHEWLGSNINSDDAFSCEYKIEDLEV